ncbi:TetR/AcrR family transcriptional regulator [Brachybacterium sp. UNK5269]|uniref:TetR/AcrR family transcriptional regulator n=1 Tax=Brachybacterium sp. UNK5269 TaxID=3408576 RepID=UPI003BB20DF6
MRPREDSAVGPATGACAGRTLAPEAAVPAASSPVRLEEAAPTRFAPPRRGRTRREQVLDGAAEMFAEHGYHGASLRDIARRVGLSHPGMLHHFASKDDLLGAVIDRLEAHAQDALDRVDELCTSREAMLQALLEIWDPASASMQLLATFDAEVVSEDHPGRYRIARLHRVHEHVLEHCFTELAERGMLRDGVDPAFASRATLAMVLRHAVREKTVRAMRSGDHDDSPAADLGRLSALFLAEDDA